MSPPERRSTRCQIRSAERGDQGIAACASQCRSGAGSASYSSNVSGADLSGSPPRMVSSVTRLSAGRRRRRSAARIASVSRSVIGPGLVRVARA